MDAKQLTEKRQQLKELIRTEPTLAESFASVDRQFDEALQSLHGIGHTRIALKTKLNAIADAKAELAALPSEPPADEPAATK